MTQEVLKMALEALEFFKELSLSMKEIERAEEAITAIKEALAEQPAQPQQEPVACVQDLDEVKRKHLVYEKGMDWKDPLYTSPPQRTWVGLTDDEHEESVNVCLHVGVEGLVFWLEAKLKEKNT